MLKVMILGSWSACVGTDYCDALGIYESLEQAARDAENYAWDSWKPQEDDTDDEGPDYYTEIYDPEKHDMLKAGGGTFAADFKRMLDRE